MPYYSEYNSSRRKGSMSQNQNASASNPSAPVILRGDSISHSPPVDFADLLEPAIDGPPSPERIRQLSKQMKRASHLNRPPQGHRAASSGSSSLRSSTGERPAWEQALENMSLARRPSQRSTTSSNPSRERPDSVQALGKNIFHRRGKSKRESADRSSSGSSLYSEVPPENPLPPRKESIIPTIFTRRKSRDETAATQKKLQISGPFNFQHVTHTQKDQLPNIQRGNRMELASEFSGMRNTPDLSGVPSGLRRGSQGDALHFRNPFAEDDKDLEMPMTGPAARPHLKNRQTASVSGPRRLLKHAMSQDQLRFSPPRPPRPPRMSLEPFEIVPPLPPVPPRVSSRQGMRPDGDDTIVTTTLDRPQTCAGFRRPQPFSPGENIGPTEQPPSTSHGLMAPDDVEGAAELNGRRGSHAITTPDDMAWPLTTSGTVERPLPDVPEEEEQYALGGHSRAGIASRSSLRGSQSVPVLRAFPERPMSGASDTLGPFDVTQARYVASEEDVEGPIGSPLRGCWEDDIDYCYEHEADANFDYEWERPSLDAGRGFVPPPVQVALVDDELMEANPGNAALPSPGMLSASRPDVPDLSRSSQASTAVGHEALATSSNLTIASNFSLPRTDKPRRPSQLRHSRTNSQASSFKECHGFTLSPSLLIPTDYHQEMLLSETERLDYLDEDDFMTHSVGSISCEDGLVMNDSSQHSPRMYQRASTSTMTTTSTSLSDVTGERHISTNSTWTSLTRLTSSTSLSKMAASFSENSEAAPASVHSIDHFDDDRDEEVEPQSATEKDTVPELTPFPSIPLGRKANHKSHASESLLRDELPPLKSVEAPKTRRARARTASLSAQAPPVGQYALFPKTYVKGNGDRI